MADRVDVLTEALSGQAKSGPKFDVVTEVTSILESIPDRTRFLNSILSTARRCFLSNHEAILSFHKPTKRWFVEAANNMTTDELEEIKGLSRTVIELTRQSISSLLIGDALSDSLLGDSRSVRLYNIQSVVTAPIEVNADLWGLIYLANTSVPNAFDEESREQLERFAKFVGMAITRCEDLVQASVPPLRIGVESGSLFLDTRSPSMAEVMHVLRQSAPTDASVLLTGETGSGKDVMARWIHEHSLRRSKPMTQINCAELSPNLIEVELFGVESGVATGVGFREGRIRIADGSTVFLNEIGELPLSIQAKILRVISDRVVERVGGRTTLGVDVRFIAATNKDLKSLVERGEFRRDLYHRINVFEVYIPSLNERREDISILAEHVLEQACRQQKRPKMWMSKKTIEYLVARNWPGNIRELENLIHRSIILSAGDELIVGSGSSEVGESSKPELPRKPTPLKDAVHDFESALIRRELHRFGWIEARAARSLGIPESTLRAKMNKYKIQRPKRIR